MNTKQSYARITYEYQPTIIETRPLLSRLATQLAFLRDDLKRSWPDFKKNPVAFAKGLVNELSKKLLVSPNTIPASMAAMASLICIVAAVLVLDRTNTRTPSELTSEESEQVTLFDVSFPQPVKSDSIGLEGRGRVGFKKDTGEGSGAIPRPAGGGGGGGNRNPLPSQVGKLPPPSPILAAIPTAPPKNPPSLPDAGIDIDPALWKDLKGPVYGDPNSTSHLESKGPGEGEGIGSNNGLGVGPGKGPGYGEGEGGNMGRGPKQTACCGDGAGRDGNASGTPFSGSRVDQRARLLSKPEPQYTEEARRNQVTGTVMLRVVFSSNGEVVQVRAVRTLPFGLTERAIAAARQIKFVPAMKGGQPVSVFMQLEYNFNLY